MVRLFMFVNRFLCIRLLQLEDVDWDLARKIICTTGFFITLFPWKCSGFHVFINKLHPKILLSMELKSFPWKLSNAPQRFWTKILGLHLLSGSCVCKKKKKMDDMQRSYSFSISWYQTSWEGNCWDLLNRKARSR